MSVEENKAIFRRFLEEILNQGNLEFADEIFGRYIAHQPDGSTLERGPEDIKRFTGEFTQISPIFMSASRTRLQKATRW
jgi:predicted SnoaL-like aldol condensation-catalyzing enzyme